MPILRSCCPPCNTQDPQTGGCMFNIEFFDACECPCDPNSPNWIDFVTDWLAARTGSTIFSSEDTSGPGSTCSTLFTHDFSPGQHYVVRVEFISSAAPEPDFFDPSTRCDSPITADFVEISFDIFGGEDASGDVSCDDCFSTISATDTIIAYCRQTCPDYDGSDPQFVEGDSGDYDFQGFYCAPGSPGDVGDFIVEAPDLCGSFYDNCPAEWYVAITVVTDETLDPDCDIDCCAEYCNGINYSTFVGADDCTIGISFEQDSSLDDECCDADVSISGSTSLAPGEDPDAPDCDLATTGGLFDGFGDALVEVEGTYDCWEYVFDGDIDSFTVDDSECADDGRTSDCSNYGACTDTSVSESFLGAIPSCFSTLTVIEPDGMGGTTSTNVTVNESATCIDFVDSNGCCFDGTAVGTHVEDLGTLDIFCESGQDFIEFNWNDLAFDCPGSTSVYTFTELDAKNGEFFDFSGPDVNGDYVLKWRGPACGEVSFLLEHTNTCDEPICLTEIRFTPSGPTCYRYDMTADAEVNISSSDFTDISNEISSLNAANPGSDHKAFIRFRPVESGTIDYCETCLSEGTEITSSGITNAQQLTGKVALDGCDPVSESGSDDASDDVLSVSLTLVTGDVVIIDVNADTGCGSGSTICLDDCSTSGAARRTNTSKKFTTASSTASPSSSSARC